MNDYKKEDLFGYQAHLYKLAEEDGGGWAAEIPELPGCFSDGETPEEALTNVRDAILGWIEIAKEDGKEIPQPNIGIEPQYSGKFTVRVAKTLHKKLADKANEENISLNQLVNSLLSYNLGYLNGEIAQKNDKEQAASFDGDLWVKQLTILGKRNEINRNPEIRKMLEAIDTTPFTEDKFEIGRIRR